ncbi:MAG: response regulator [Desulfobulbaceae bacterium]|nr:response regulator [Desulfobulbaceae bacterium]MCK5545486.1 response regulator [Desulfobulbaceae bacterium]
MSRPNQDRKSKILIVDDISANRRLIADILYNTGNYNIMTAADGMATIEAIEVDLPDLVLLDIMMPGMDGYEVARILKGKEATRDVPIIFITAKTDLESKIAAFEHGGIDYITKPFNRHELLARVGAHVQLKNLQDDMREKNRMLEDREIHLVHLVDEKTKKIEEVTHALVTALEDANLANDDDTGNHIKRVSGYSAVLAESLGHESQFVKRIKLFSSLHDVGKVGISDFILKKPGKYTPEEFEQMKKHVEIGGRMLENKVLDPMARSIAMYHHEKWAGNGYLAGLAGEDIPIEARIVALADVFDALTTKRVYKEPFSIEKTEKILSEERGRHFDPQVVDAYFDARDTIHWIMKKLV